MNAKNDPRNVADACGKDLTYLRTLLFAADDKVQFYLSNRSLLGPYWELLTHHAAELGILLSLTQERLEQLEGGMELLSEHFYAAQPPAAG